MHAWPFALFHIALAVLPLRARQQHLAWGMALSFGAFGWYLLGLAPTLSGDSLEGPFGGPPVLFAAATVVNVLRLRSLRSPAVAQWVAQELDLASDPDL